MRVLFERERHGLLIRFMSRWTEVAYIVLGLRGLCLDIEFPTEWHDRKRGWVRIGLGVIKVCVSFPWKWTAPDYMQCSGPTYGFCFFADELHLYYGQGKGMRGDPIKVLAMLWQWRHVKHEITSPTFTFQYMYELRSGEVQMRWATVKSEERTWVRPWLPYKRVSRSLDVSFDKEVGERSGSWKGGVTGCSWEMLPHESCLAALRRMEAERKFT